MALITQKISCDLQMQQSRQIISAKQYDLATRQIKVFLYDGGAAFNVPNGYIGVFAYKKADGIGGAYDEIVSGTPAITFSGNTATIDVHPQVLTCPGMVNCELQLTSSSEQLATFTFQICVEASVTNGAASEPYYNITSLSEAIAAATAAVTASNTAMQKAEAVEAAAARGDFNGADAVVWYTTATPSQAIGGGYYIAINALTGPAGAKISESQMVVSTYGNGCKAFWVVGIDSGVVLLAPYTAELKGEKGDTGDAGAIWYTTAGCVNNRIMIAALVGPSGAVPVAGQQVVSTYNDEAWIYVITQVDEFAVVLDVANRKSLSGNNTAVSMEGSTIVFTVNGETYDGGSSSSSSDVVYDGGGASR